ncbi:SDR family NAD(P)-dependent oxidoreductase [Devosia faecipullorum]|uniref:SDR family NAD(P)-dependent oxidoreductase n=1 Tax=Devosia faecipullorum TaxID=2755039 RepID=UPI00187B6602|nr:SDR family NAD(P)-dependent oxidoreductase [Devosia faecipullorum]MBE7732905.1 SDR family oxidoreductase [Devosia faecipullorum]
MKAHFDGKGDVIVITGGANGIGRALALAVSAAGAQAVVCDRDEMAMAELRGLDARIDTRRLDVSNRAEVQAMFGAIEAEHGAIDGLVCGAAIQPRTAIHDMDPAEWERVIGVNLNGVVWCYQAAIPGMIARRRGSVIAFSSGLANQGWAKASAYATSKAGLIAFLKSAAKEVAEHRVRVNVIWPGVIDTPQYRNANPGQDGESWKSTLGVGSAEDVVGPLMFLLSDAATMTASALTREMAYSRDMDT